MGKLDGWIELAGRPARRRSFGSGGSDTRDTSAHPGSARGDAARSRAAAAGRIAARGLLAVAAAVALAGCRTLPDYAAPQGELLPPGARISENSFPYRPLTRSDFRGAAPPREFGEFRDRLGAASCVHLVTAPGLKIKLVGTPSDTGALQYHASLLDLRFRALIDPDCSWWNEKQDRLPHDYVLQHEQIHFAIVEAEARRLDRRAAQIAERCRATADSAEAAKARAQERLQQELATGLAAALERSREFDEDASMYYRPERQNAWWNELHAELDALAE